MALPEVRNVMAPPHSAQKQMSYTRGCGDAREHVRQTVRLSYTVPNYGGKRWWMICP